MASYLKESLRQALGERAGTPRVTTEPIKPSNPLLNKAGTFEPVEPETFAAAGLEEGMVEGLIIKHLANYPGRSGRQVADHLALARKPVRELLLDLKQRKLVVHRGGTATGDFLYELSEAGRDFAQDLMRQTRYADRAPIPLGAYLESVEVQSISRQNPGPRDLERAFSDLLLPATLLNRLGPAMTSGKGMFLYGHPGNGKTSIAERCTKAFGDNVFIPYALWIEGHLIKVFDPMVHHPIENAPPRNAEGVRLDRRWVLCRRPTVIAGGELTLDSLEMQFDPNVGINEAPLQVKANTGTLVIDDFGRQRVEPVQLLNRWIVPLEHRVDYLRLPDGRKVRFPFDPLLVFSTNLDPKALVDEAFVRRIPYKIEVPDPDEATFRELMRIQSRSLGFPVDEAVIDYTIATHYVAAGRKFRCCHPRDLMLQVYNQCLFRRREKVLTPESIDEAASLYFPLMDSAPS